MHIEHPKMLYKVDQTKIVNNSAEETAARADGWHDYGKEPVAALIVVSNDAATPPATPPVQDAANAQSTTITEQDNPSVGSELTTTVVDANAAVATPPATPADQDVDKAELITQAKALGINANNTWNVGTIKVRIDEALNTKGE